MTEINLKIFLALMVVSVAIIGGYALSAHSKSKEKRNLANASHLEEERMYWEEEIEQEGGLVAWENFKLRYRDVPGGAHAQAHIFGELLFEKEGIKGVSVCDSSFGFGCYHSFFGKAISAYGLPVLKELDQACVERWGLKGLGCPHGIGHGILWYLDSPKLVEALTECSKLSWQEPIGGCTSGVFMEYNFHTMADPNFTELRSFDPKNPFTPCDTVPAKFAQACYFEQPQWWNQVLARDASKIGILCAEVGDKLSREACFRGYGNILAADVGYSVERATIACEEMPTKGEQNLCLQGVSWGFSAEPKVKHLSPSVCKTLPQEEREVCAAGADIFHDKTKTNL